MTNRDARAMREIVPVPSRMLWSTAQRFSRNDGPLVIHLRSTCDHEDCLAHPKLEFECFLHSEAAARPSALCGTVSRLALETVFGNSFDRLSRTKLFDSIRPRLRRRESLQRRTPVIFPVGEGGDGDDYRWCVRCRAHFAPICWHCGAWVTGEGLLWAWKDEGCPACSPAFGTEQTG